MTYDRPKKKKGQGKWEVVRTVEMSFLSGITHYIGYIFLSSFSLSVTLFWTT